MPRFPLEKTKGKAEGSLSGVNANIFPPETPDPSQCPELNSRPLSPEGPKHSVLATASCYCFPRPHSFQRPRQQTTLSLPWKPGIRVLIPSSGKQAQTHADVAGSSTENHSYLLQSNPGEERWPAGIQNTSHFPFPTPHTHSPFSHHCFVLCSFLPFPLLPHNLFLLPISLPFSFPTQGPRSSPCLPCPE